MNKSMNEVTAWLKALVHDGAHLRLDSRSVKPGDVFVAVPGLKADGRAFIRVAAARGAAGFPARAFRRHCWKCALCCRCALSPASF